MRRSSAGILLAGLALAQPVAAADLSAPPSAGRFRATCEDLGQFCFADACGRDQIEATQACRAQCSHSVVLTVVPAACLLPDRPPTVILRRRG